MTGHLEDTHAAMERKVNRIWTDLSSFEESSATCISDMLLLVAAGAYVEGFRMACQFVMHLQVLFGALDDIQHQMIVHLKGRIHVYPSHSCITHSFPSSP